MVKPYESITITVNADNVEDIEKSEVERVMDIARAADTYRSATSQYSDDPALKRADPRAKTDAVQWTSFVGDARTLEFIGKTPESLKGKCKTELQAIKENRPGVERHLSSTLLNETVNTATSGLSEESKAAFRRTVSFLGQQVGNDITTAVTDNFTSSKQGFLFNHQCSPITANNQLETSGGPFNSVKKKSESHYYYFVDKNDKSSNPRAMYLDANGNEKYARVDEINELAKKGKCLPLIIVISEATVRVDENKNPIVETSHTYHAQPEYAKWSGPDYPGMTRSPPNVLAPYVSVEHQFNNLNATMIETLELISQYDASTLDVKNILKHDFEQLRRDIPQLKGMLDNIKRLHSEYQQAGMLRRRFMEGDVTKSILDLQQAIRKSEDALSLTPGDLKQLYRLNKQVQVMTQATDIPVRSMSSRAAEAKQVSEALDKGTKDKATPIEGAENIPLNRTMLSSKSVKDVKKLQKASDKTDKVLRDVSQLTSKKPRQ